jgi:membrane protein implicated in regulation of membrane protease activity
MEFLLANFGYVWLGLMVIFIMFEAATAALLTIWFAVGSLAAAITSFITDNLFIQAIVFLVVSALTILLLRPYIGNIKKKATPTNADAIIGKNAIVTE